MFIVEWFLPLLILASASVFIEDKKPRRIWQALVILWFIQIGVTA